MCSHYSYFPFFVQSHVIAVRLREPKLDFHLDEPKHPCVYIPNFPSVHLGSLSQQCPSSHPRNEQMVPKQGLFRARELPSLPPLHSHPGGNLNMLWSASEQLELSGGLAQLFPSDFFSGSQGKPWKGIPLAAASIPFMDTFSLLLQSKPWAYFWHSRGHRSIGFVQRANMLI